MTARSRSPKGAPQVILDLAANTAEIQPDVDAAVDDFAARGFRSLGVARADGDGDWRFLGVLPLFDPPREDAKTTIATARAMGMTVKMVTGDALAIAEETARKVGLGTNVLDATGLGDVQKKEAAAVAESIETTDGFAQVFPEHKYHIVDVLQRRGHIVGMTGDGVNDAPALKKADCGIAVSGATDARAPYLTEVRHEGSEFRSTWKAGSTPFPKSDECCCSELVAEDSSSRWRLSGVLG